jgi:probable rRNA maturation factor
MRRRAQKMLSHLGLGAVELSIALVDDATIRALNRTYRHKDKPTDVLAFPLHGGASHSTLAQEALLGDVIVSVETARRQAARRRLPLLAELTMLLAHGLLHLLGYDHQTDAQEREMTARTRNLVAAAATRQGRPGSMEHRGGRFRARARGTP